jgi:hypothetical protein
MLVTQDRLLEPPHSGHSCVNPDGLPFCGLPSHKEGGLWRPGWNQPDSSQAPGNFTQLNAIAQKSTLLLKHRRAQKF